MESMTSKELEKAEKKARSACMVVLSPLGDGSMLAMTRRQDFNDIGLPGGKIDKGEHPADAAVRECYEETGILVDRTSIKPVVCHMARTLPCITYVASSIVGGKLLQVSKEGLPMWVHPHMFLKEACTYKKYNQIVISRLVSLGKL
jgi:8-oxo-dGTP pyrophosphatase MutT (NUDIX family)